MFVERLLLWIFGKPRRIENEFWGTLTDADSYYECSKHFTPIGKEIEICLKGKEDGNNQSQKDFYLKIEIEYDLLIEKIKPSLTQKIQTWIKDYHIENLKRDFTTNHIVIPEDCSQSPLFWEISFYENNRLNHWCHLYLSDYEVTEIHIDG